MMSEPFEVSVLEEETGVEYVFRGVTQKVLDARVDAFLLRGEPTWVERNPAVE